MACPHGGLKTGCGIVGAYYKWINNGLNPPDRADTWFIDGKSTLIIQNNQFNHLQQPTIITTNIPEILSLLSGLEIRGTNSNSLRLGSERPVIIKGNANVWSTCGKFDGFKKFTYTIAYCCLPNPDGLTSPRMYIQTHIIRFYSPVIIPNPGMVYEEISDVDVDGPGIVGLGLSTVQEYYHCLVESADVAGREFYWLKSMMLKGGPKPEETLICAENAPEIKHLLSFMNITQVTVTGVCSVYEPNTKTVLVDVSGIAKYHNDYRVFSELFCVSPPLIPSPMELKLKEYYNHNPTIYGADSHDDVGGRRFRFACSLIEFLDPPLFTELWSPLIRRPGTIPQSYFPTTPEDPIRQQSVAPIERFLPHEEQPDDAKSRRLSKLLQKFLVRCRLSKP